MRDYLIPWEKIQFEYESGMYTINRISNKYKIPAHQISTKAHLKGWEKGKNKAMIEQKIEKKMTEKFSDAFVDEGIEEGEIAKAIKEMIYAKRKNIMNEEVTDMSARDKGLKHYESLTGSNAPIKTENKSLNVFAKFENKSLPEIENELKRLKNAPKEDG